MPFTRSGSCFLSRVRRGIKRGDVPAVYFQIIELKNLVWIIYTFCQCIRLSLGPMRRKKGGFIRRIGAIVVLLLNGPLTLWRIYQTYAKSTPMRSAATGQRICQRFCQARRRRFENRGTRSRRENGQKPIKTHAIAFLGAVSIPSGHRSIRYRRPYGRRRSETLNRSSGP